ncbi:MAG TPA: methylenetetrahydrofolate--tRNA-(uracil(54)-C(5))-methyltransferase (FADH(2)-oxidizing) TrmFO [Polyangia bacterium]|nr:methylenetetrahydrofolate--tRNA-(uracil(54)-C(5))-methyltransferase (FADH(2)-oxidizing) TrmFO [Polyangia bacterium]
MFRADVTVVGGGLAGCEAAWQLAQRGLRVSLVEQKPGRISPAHTTPLLAELVCSNSLRSDDPTTPAGLLKAELRRAGSLVLRAADGARVPAGEALAVDRQAFSRAITVALALEPRVRIERRPLDRFPDGPIILAGGPLVSGGIARELRQIAGDRFYFYDAIAPIVDADTIDWAHAFRGSRWGKSSGGGSHAEGDYVNCPLSRDQYHAFVRELRAGKKVLPHAFEEPRYFEGCLPIEVMAERGDDVLAFGPMKPVGLDTRAYAVVQLRAENRYATSYNLVGFQTRLTYGEQKRIFAMVPALAGAEFLRFGSIHRNSYLESWRLCGPELELRARPDVRLAGQITGVEGYIESTAIGLLAALFLHGRLAGRPVAPPPPTTAFGALYHHVMRARQPGEGFQPTNINFGLLPPLDERAKKRDRRALQAARAEGALTGWLAAL